MSGAISILKSIDFSPILVELILASISISFLKLYVSSVNSILFDSILFKSKMLPTISSNVLDASKI